MSEDLERRRVRAQVAGALFGATDESPIEVGRYRILEHIGSGGMSVVYAARDTLLGRRVALKLVSSSIREPARRAEYQARLLREGEALASVNHPNVVAVLDAGEHDGQAFLALELVDGRSLAAWLAERERPWRAVLDAVLAAADGLAAAHASGLVHRDVTPRNLVIDTRGIARVVDFGLVRAGEARDDGDEREPPSADLTRTGATMGTPPYMAPEQWRRGTVDARTDQFGLCATLFEAVYGQRPFGGTTTAELERAITAGALVPPAAGGDVPPWLYELVARGLAVDPDARHGSIADLVEAIRARLRSVEDGGRAELALARLRALLDDDSADAAAIDRVGGVVRAACDDALAAWPENPDAGGVRDQAVAALLDREVERGNLEPAERLLADLRQPDPARAAAVEALRARVGAIESRLAKLDRIERETDLDMEAPTKLGLLAGVALSHAVAFLVFGVLTRRGTYAVGAAEVGGFYGTYLLLHGASMLAFRRAHFANAVNRKLSLQGAVAYGSHGAMFAGAALLSVPVAAAFVASHVLSTGLWLMIAIYSDRRGLIVPPFTALAAAVTVAWPGLCFEAAAAAALAGLGGVAISWGRRESTD